MFRAIVRVILQLFINELFNSTTVVAEH